jgi:hypothetical protein
MIAKVRRDSDAVGAAEEVRLVGTAVKMAIL